jgi:protocatechuate 4,5-dioxygenase, alpha chain
MSSDDFVRREPIEGFDDVPGTTLFDAQRARQGYWVNQFCMSLMKAQNRAEFKADEDKYLRNWKMSDEQREAILTRNWARMIELGGNIYYLSKLFSTDGKSFQYVAATMTGLTQARGNGPAPVGPPSGRAANLLPGTSKWPRS